MWSASWALSSGAVPARFTVSSCQNAGPPPRFAPLPRGPALRLRRPRLCESPQSLPQKVPRMLGEVLQHPEHRVPPLLIKRRCLEAKRVHANVMTPTLDGRLFRQRQELRSVTPVPILLPDRQGPHVKPPPFRLAEQPPNYLPFRVFEKKR